MFKLEFMQDSNVNEEIDQDIVAIWLRRDPTRWIAGAVAGLFASVIAMAFAMILSKIGGAEIWLPIKVMALPIIGNSATAYGLDTHSIGAGLATILILCAVLGVVYAHFSGAGASIQALLGLGVTWGLFSWVFIMNLFMQSFHDVQFMELPQSVTLAISLVFGVSLASVLFFDRVFRGSKKH